jgi:transposase
MQYTNELLSILLNLGEDWTISDFRIDMRVKEVDLFIEYNKSEGKFPNSEEICKVYDFSKYRRLRHLDLFEYKTFINVRFPRLKNSKSEVRIIDVSWAGERVSYTHLFEDRVIEALLMSKNQTKTASFFDISFDIVNSIMKRAVSRGLKRRNLSDVYALSIDEKSFRNGHNYFTILSDPIQKRILDIIEGRKTEDAEELLTWTLSPTQLEKVKLITMDMWKPFMAAAGEVIPHAEIIHDKFHVAKYLNKGVDDTRKKEIKKQEILRNNKYLFLKNKDKWSEEQAIKFEEINQINLLTSQAWKIKENFKGIYNQWSKKSCLDYFEIWYKNTIQSEISPMIKVAKTMLNHLKGIINAAVYELSNSVAENLNSQIQVLKSTARGFNNINGYRNSILFYNGKLNLFSL